MFVDRGFLDAVLKVGISLISCPVDYTGSGNSVSFLYHHFFCTANSKYVTNEGPGPSTWRRNDRNCCARNQRADERSESPYVHPTGTPHKSSQLDFKKNRASGDSIHKECFSGN